MANRFDDEALRHTQQLIQALDREMERSKLTRADVHRQAKVSRRALYTTLCADGVSWRNAKVLNLMRALRALRIAPGDFFRQAFPSHGRNPVWKLRQARGLVPNDEHAIVLRNLIDQEIEPIVFAADLDLFLDPEAERIDRLREKQRDLALSQAIMRIRECRPPVDEFGRRRFDSPKQFASYLSAFGALACIHRVSGRYNLAAVALEHVLSLSVGQYETVVGADLKARAAGVLRDLAAGDLGISELEEAQSIFALAGHLRKSRQTLIKIAARHGELGDQKRAIAILQGLRTPTSKTSPREAFAVHVNLAYFLTENRPDEALKVLEQLIGTPNMPGTYLAKAHWHFATVESNANPGSDRANQAFLKALEMARADLEPAELLLIFLDFAAGLLSTGRMEDLLAHADQALRDVEQLDSTALTRAIAREVVECAEKGILGAKNIAGFKSRLEASLRRHSQPSD